MGYPTSNNLNAQLRHIFDPIDPPATSVPIFYDMAVHFTDTSWYVKQNYDTSSTTIFTALFDEIYCAHYDTSSFWRMDTMYDRSQRFGKDTVLLGLIDYNFARLKPGALNDSNWFYVDTVNNQYIDNPYALSEPYRYGNIFTVAPLKNNFGNGQVVFRIDPDFLFIDSISIHKYDETNLEIDFGDGNGWNIFNHSQISHYTATYLNSQIDRLIKARVISDNGSDTSFAQTKAIIPPSQQLTAPVDTWSFSDMDIGVYPGCGTTQDLATKFIVYVEGFDYFHDYEPAHLYGKLKDCGLAQLRNHGYTFLAVSWKKPEQSMETNAFNLVTLLNYLKCNYVDPNEPEPFVVMGESMGGIIARYALAFMEDQPIDGECYRELLHNTRLYVSIDAPHQGAYVPLAFQVLYNQINTLGLSSISYQGKFDLKKLEGMLDCTAAKQLLNIHASTYQYSSNTYSAAPERGFFMSNLQSFGDNGYPRYAKKVALTNGLLTGEHQLGNYNDCISSVGDKYVEVDLDFDFTVLGFPLTGVYFDLDLNRFPPQVNFTS